ncbi:MAG: hypothetical protein ACFE0R_05825 [Salinarimonas sp.]
MQTSLPAEQAARPAAVLPARVAVPPREPERRGEPPLRDLTERPAAAPAAPDVLVRAAPLVRVVRTDETPQAEPREAGSPAPTPARVAAAPPSARLPTAPTPALVPIAVEVDGTPARLRRSDGNGYDVL